MSRHGQSLAEYTLAACLVALVGVGALLFLSSAATDAMPPLLERIFEGGNPQTAVSNPMSVSMTAPDPGSFQEVELTLSSGDTIKLPAYHPGLTTAVESSGANGATDLLANRLAALARELRDTGDITDKQAKSLMALANQGHRIAQIERMIEDAAAVNPDFDFGMHMFDFEGRSLCPGDLSKLIGLEAPGKNMFGNNIQTGPEMGKLIAEYNAAKNTGALDNPNVAAAVTYLVQEIGDIAGNFTDIVSDLHDGNMDLHGPLRNQVASRMTNRDSAVICATGGNTDSGASCG